MDLNANTISGTGKTITSSGSSQSAALPSNASGNSARIVRVVGTGNAYIRFFSGTQATGTPVLTADAVTSVTVTNGGAGYATAPSVTFSGGGGTGAAGTAVVSNGAVTSVTITNGGSSYETAPTVAFGPPNTAVTSDDILVGAFESFFITQGSHYISILQETSGAKVSISPIEF